MEALELTKDEWLRFAVANSLNYDIKKAQEVYDFVSGAPKSAPTLNVKVEPLSDGIYYVLNDKSLVPVAHIEIIDKNKVVGVAVKMSDKIASVALHDAANGEKVALVVDDDEESGTEEFYRPDFFDAITDWEGEANTKDYGDKLNQEIELQPGQYIPSLAQLHLILLNIKEVNVALEAVGGTPLRKEWYWSSAEYSAYHSWYVHFNSGSSGNYYKYNTIVVRPAVACQP